MNKEIEIFIPDDHILSTQHIYGYFRGRVYMKKEGKEKKEYYSTMVKPHFKTPFDGDITLDILLSFPDKRRRDVDNYNKIILDSLTGIVYNDDSQIIHLGINKKIKSEKSGITLIIRNFDYWNVKKEK